MISFELLTASDRIAMSGPDLGISKDWHCEMRIGARARFITLRCMAASVLRVENFETPALPREFTTSIPGVRNRTMSVFSMFFPSSPVPL